MDEQPCNCLNAPLPADQYQPIRFIGVDKTNGRFAAVNLWQCKTCARCWLHYLWENEGFTASGRYYMSLITPEAAEGLTPETAVAYLNQLDWHLYGGSYYNGRQGRANQSVNLP
jgi:hypothetical protein